MAEKGNETENLSRIKEILFGEDLTSIDERLENFKKENAVAFQDIKDYFNKQAEGLEKLINENQKHFETNVLKTEKLQDNFKEKVEQDIANMHLEINKEKTEVQKMIQNLEIQNKEKFEGLIKNINNSVTELKDLLNSKFDELNDKKTDSAVIAELFQTMADKLKA